MTMTAITYDDMRKGCWDRDERIKDLTLNYTDGSLPFPTFPRFCGQTFYEAKDKELALACVGPTTTGWSRSGASPRAAYNIPLCLIPLVGRRTGRGRDEAQRRARGPGHRLQRDPHPPQTAEHQHRLLGPAVGGLQRLRRDGVHARGLEQLQPRCLAGLAPGRRWHARLQQRHGVAWPTGSSRATCSDSPS